jgi:quinol monooxygenase YgiN
MAQEILAIAYIRPNEGHEQETVDLLRELFAVLTRKNYSRDRLFRDAGDSSRLVGLRFWTSEEARAAAHEDPDVHKFWMRLGQVCQVEYVIERLEEISGSTAKSSVVAD